MRLHPFSSDKEVIKAARQASYRDRVNPCARCGWGEHTGIHSLAKGGPRDGLPWGHAFIPPISSSEGRQESDGK